MVCMTQLAVLLLSLAADPVLSLHGLQCPGAEHGDTSALLQVSSISPTIREGASAEPLGGVSGSLLETDAALSEKAPTSSKIGHSAGEAFIEHMRGVVDKHAMRAHSAAADAQAKLDGLLAHFPSSVASSASFQARVSSAIHASKTVREAAKVAHNLANDFVDQIGSSESEVRSFSEKMEAAAGPELRSLTEQREPAVSFLSELVLGSSVLMGTSVEELETWFEHSLGDAEQKEPASWDWKQVVTALLTRSNSESLQAPDATHRALHAAVASRAALTMFTERLDSSMKAGANLDEPISLNAAHELAISTQRMAAVLLGEDEAPDAEEQSASGGQTVALPSFHLTLHHPSEEELVTRMRGMVDHYYSQDRTAVASARAKLEELVAQNRTDSFDTESREAEVEAASAIVESGRAVRSLAGEMANEISNSKRDLEFLVQKLVLLEDAEPVPAIQVTAQEANIEVQVAPVEALLQEFLSGSAALLGSSITELQGFYIKTLAPRHSVPANKKKGWEWPAFASSGLLLLSVDPDTTQKTLDIAESAHWMLVRLMDRLDESLAETSRLLSRVPATSENLKGSLGQDIATSSLKLAGLLEVDFVVEEARSAAGRRSQTLLPAFIAAFAAIAHGQA